MVKKTERSKHKGDTSTDHVRLFSPASPHLHSGRRTKEIMQDVLIALAPAVLGSIYLFGWTVIPYYLVAVAAAVVSDVVWRKYIVKRGPYMFDYSPVVTGVLLAMSLPATAPLWFPALGAFVGIVLAKELFGGIGCNFLNPAVAGRGLLRILFVREMTRNAFPSPPFAMVADIDAVSGATPLMVLKEGGVLSNGELVASFLGTVGGKIGETNALLLLIGAAYLLWKGVIRWRIPVSMLGSMAVVALLYGGPNGFLSADYRIVLGYVLGGASILGAFYMATDYSSSPSSPAAQYLFGIGCGVLTMLWRFFSSYSEGFTFALLLMNCTVPLMNRYIRPRVLGESRSAGIL